MNTKNTIMDWSTQHVYNFITGLFVAFFGYFIPIGPIIYVMISAILIDMFIGIWASRAQGYGIKSGKLWKTAWKLLFALVIVHLTFAMDQEMGIDAIQLHRVIAFIITGWEIWSILENSAKISDHSIFRILKKFMHDKIEQHTGVDLDDTNLE
jgi:phage-related holin